MTNPDVKFVGVDSIGKKVKAVNEMIEELGIKNAKAVWTRIEEFKGQSFDYVTARAVGYVDKVIDWAYHLLKIGGYFIFYKQFSPEEKLELVKVCKTKKLKIVKNYSYKLFPEDIQRVIYIIKKL